MSLALPGFVDTGVSQSFVHTGNIALLMAQNPVYGGFNQWQLGASISFEESPGCPELFAWIQRVLISEAPDVDLISTVLQETVTCWSADGGGTPAPAAAMSDSFAFEETTGPYRLGVRWKVIDGTPAQAPYFAAHYELEYQWFADEATTQNTEIDGVAADTRYFTSSGWGLAPEPGVTPVQSAINGLAFQCTLAGLGQVEVEFRGMSAAGFGADTSGLATSIMTGLGGGDVDCEGTGGDTETIHVPHVVAYDIDLPKFGGSTSSGVGLTSSFNGAISTPYTPTTTYHDSSWDPGGYTDETLDIASGASETLYPTNDRAVLLWGTPARLNPSTGNQYYQPVTIELAEPTELALGGFVNQTPTKLNIIDAVGQLDVEAVDTGGSVRKEYGAPGTDLPAWRKWLGVGVSGHGDAAFNPDLSHSTAFPWDWTSYRYLRVDLNSPGAGVLYLTVEGVYLDIEDPHTTGLDRGDNFAVTETPYTVTYAINVTATGSNFYYLDLCFPDGATVPHYHGRIDAIRFHEWPLGDWILNGLDLYSLETKGLGTRPGEVNLKVGFGAPVQRGDYSATHASHNAANPMLNLGDQSNKPEEIGAYGGALRYVNILTGAVTGIIQDSQLTLEEFWAQWSNIAGWTATWDSAAHDAANKDSFGNELGAGMADWSRPGAFIFDAGAPGYEPKCQPMVRRIKTPAGYTIAVYSRHPVYSSVEALAMQGTSSAPAGTSSSISGVTATCDSHGWLVFPGVPCGTTLLGHSGTLTPRDRPRVLMTAYGPPGAIDLLQTSEGWWFRARSEGVSVRVERSLDQGATWGAGVTLSAAAQEDAGAVLGTAPTLVSDAWGNVWVWFHDDTSVSRAFRSVNGGASWQSFVSHSSKLYPRAVRQLERLLIAFYEGSETRFYTSDDEGLTLTHLPKLALSMPRQLVAMRVDRRNAIHLAYTDGTELRLRTLQEGDDDWSAHVTLAANGDLPAQATGLERSLILYWNGALFGRKTDETFAADGGSINAPSGVTYYEHYLGAWSGEHFGGSEVVLVVGYEASTSVVEVRYTEDQGQTWGEPV